jgi:hypothetical protein
LNELKITTNGIGNYPSFGENFSVQYSFPATLAEKSIKGDKTNLSTLQECILKKICRGKAKHAYITKGKCPFTLFDPILHSI